MSRTGQHSITAKFTTASLSIIGIAMLWLSRDFSMSGDEAAQIQAGHNVFAFFGRSPGLLPAGTEVIGSKNYGTLFGIISTGLTKLLPGVDELHLRHFLVAVTGFFTIVYAGRIARLLHGRTAALICIWMLFCSPRFFGAGMNNPVDIPFALGMTVAAYYLLRIIRDAPVIVKRHFAGLFFGLFIATGVRIGGLLAGVYELLAFVWLARRYWSTAHRYVLRLSAWMTGTGLAAFSAAIIFLPAVWLNTPLLTFKALTFPHYPVVNTMRYRGRDIPTWEPPWHYLPVWIGITVPVVVLLLFLLSPLLLRRPGNFPILLLFLTILLPWLGVVVAHAPVYDAWRRFYFIYPPIAVLAAMGGAELFILLEGRWPQRVLAGIIALNLLLPVAWSIRNHPLENVYFNELIGGVNGAYGHFETDFYGEGTGPACRKLLQQPAFNKPLRDSVYVINNMPNGIIHYLKQHDPRIAVIHAAYEQRDRYHWDYGIFATDGPDTLLKRTGWRPAGMIDSVVADRTLLIAIVKRSASAATR